MSIGQLQHCISRQHAPGDIPLPQLAPVAERLAVGSATTAWQTDRTGDQRD
jgi:hypothetical protein